MNKLIIFFLLSLMILYINAEQTGGEQTGGEQTGGEQTEGQTGGQTGGQTVVKCNDLKNVESSACKTATDAKSNQECQFEATSGGKGNCKLVDKATNSSNILNIFKITFGLLIIFTIL